MKVEKNVGNTDRIVRAVVGVVLILLAIFMLTGALQIIVGILAVVMFVTAAMNFCPLYTLLKMNTNK